MLDGDRIRTDRGRAEVILGDGSLLLIDEATTADLLAGDLVRLIQGRLTLLVAGASDPSRAVRYQVDAPSASMQSNGPGEYRVMIDPSTGPPAVEVSVVRGDATLANDAGSIGLRAGERSRAREGEAPSRPQPFNSARSTDFDRWSAARRDARVGTTSARYLPPNLEPYAASFDRYGTWRYEASNGYVWFPTVESQWRPYSVGYWRQYDRWDSFWIAGDPWGWPTHHYGRWGFSTGYGWYWMPARSWGAGFVYWALGGDYVSWCPLGWNDYPVFGSWGVPGAYVGLYDGWYGWTVISRRHFGSSHYASRVAVDGRRFDHRTSSSFTASRRSPTLGYAVPRGQSGTAAPRMGTNGPAGGSRGVDGTGIGGRLRERSAALQSPRTTSQGRAEPAQQGAQRSSPGATLERSGQRSAP
ncbi:MAG: FecR family protein, partial [Acidobacteriota bacterium]